jgi:predicted permease
MNASGTVLCAVLPVFGIMTVGFFLRHLKWLTADADQSLLRVCVNLLLPSLIFENVLGNAALRRPENLLLPPLVGVATVLAGIGLAWGLARLTGLETPKERRTFALTTGLHNYSYIPLPLCLLLFDPGTVGVLLVHNVGVEITMWTVGVAVLSGRGLSGGWRNILSPPLVALLLALTLNALGNIFSQPATLVLPGKAFMTTVHWLGQSAIPVALLMIGAMIADHLPELRGGQFLRVVALSIFIRLLLMPILFLLLAKYLPCSVELKRVIIIQGSMSAAVLPVVLAKHYGGDSRTALQVVLGTSLAGLVAIPFWIHMGQWFIGL